MVYGLIVLTVNHPCNKLRTRSFNKIVMELIGNLNMEETEHES